MKQLVINSALILIIISLVLAIITYLNTHGLFKNDELGDTSSSYGVITELPRADFDSYKKNIDKNETLSGQLHMTLIDNAYEISNALNFGLPYEAYSIDFLDDSINKLSLNNGMTDISMFPVLNPENPEEKTLVSLSPFITVSEILETKDNYPDLRSEVFTYTNGNNSFVQKTNLTKTSEGLDIIGKRLPHYSPDGTKIAYSVQVSSDRDSVDVFAIDSWRIFIFDTKQEKEVEFASGIGPVWIDNETIAFTQESGISAKRYLSNSDTQNSPVLPLVRDLDGARYSVANQISISNDRKYLAVTFPKSDEGEVSDVYVYEVNTDILTGSVSLAVVHIINTGISWAFWPVFSPGNKFIAMQVIDRNESGDLIDPRVSVYDMTLESFIKSVSLDGYYFDYAFISDWVR